VVDLQTKEALGPHKDGEIWVRGPQVMLGYYNNEAATRETVDQDGWLHTGDVGHYDEDGYLFVVGRIKELIKYNSFQVAPAELEALILRHPDVEDVGVVGMPHEEAGELPHAWVVKKSDHVVSEQDIVKWVADHAASYKRLRGGVRFVESIPRNPTGKILRRNMVNNSEIKSKL